MRTLLQIPSSLDMFLYEERSKTSRERVKIWHRVDFLDIDKRAWSWFNTCERQPRSELPRQQSDQWWDHRVHKLTTAKTREVDTAADGRRICFCRKRTRLKRSKKTSYSQPINQSINQSINLLTLHSETRKCKLREKMHTDELPVKQLVAPIHVKLGTADGHLGPLGCAKISPQSVQGVGMRPPKYQKNSTFW